MKVITIQDVDKKNIKWGRILFFLTFFIQSSFAGPLKIALLDTGFCPELLKTNKFIKIHAPIDLTDSVKLNCAKYSKDNRRFHGQWVLEQFLKELKSKREIEITPFIIFDKNANQAESYWKKAFLKQADFHLFITAAGLPYKGKANITKKITRPIFVAGATLGKGIRKSSTLWPQVHFNHQQVFTIGSFLEKDQVLGSREDYTLLRPKEMKFFFSSGPTKDHFKGSSRAVATASARAINHCYEVILKSKPLSKCLEKKRILLPLEEGSLKLPTF
ncbi:hypothetical protein A9Q84_12615 [Halobacteriovorax marinus]|uniref:Uncharacterized protein n=1 Tax=Halobacteriovorax marinus TaxID=97084 RepID=A0A1Y5F8F9_9BACT|nr:hypothetical protein A9Q84_12615 [Halobacteriovorax marinus]